MKVSEFYHAESHWLRHPDLKGQARTVVIEQITHTYGGLLSGLDIYIPRAHTG